MKKRIWGIPVIVAAVCVLLAGLGVNFGPIGTLPTVPVIVVAIAAALCLCFAVNGAWELLPYPPAVAFLLVENNLADLIGRSGEDLIGFWPVAGCAVLMSIGISMIASPAKKRAAR